MRSRPIIGGFLGALILTLLMPSMASARNPRGAVSTGGPFIGACPVTSGTITLAATTPRSTGISPLLVFFDATATTDSATLGGANTAFQDVSYTWTFGDGGSSGTSKWAYGSNPGVNSKNTATGGIAAHLYITSGADAPYTATVTANDGTSTASCTVAITAYDPAGSNGFPGAATTCYGNTLPVAGSGGCPASASVASASTFAAVNGTLSNKRLLYKCGDTFTGDNEAISGTKVSVGAYGGCEGTQTSRPIFQDTSTNYHINIVQTASDVRVADIDFQSSGGTSGGAVSMAGGPSGGESSQVTLVNLNSVGNKAGYYWGQSTQSAVIGSVHNSTSTSGIALYINSNDNNCVNGNTTFNCGGTPSFININYEASLGNYIYGVGNGNVETVRVGACRMCVIENNSVNATVGVSTVGSNLKFHSGNTNGSLAPWLGQYGEFDEISDNSFGPNGGSGIEIAPQNGGDDERLRYIVVERNISLNNTQNNGGRQSYMSGQNLTFRDNAFNMEGFSATILPIVAIQPMTRGGATYPAWQSINLEVYDNTCIVTGSTYTGQECVGNDGTGGLPAASNSFFKNNMMYSTGSAPITAHDTGSGNTASNNTVSPSANPAFTNGTGAFNLITDFKPTANYSGGASVPVFTDALGIAWPPTWDLGAVHH